MEVWHRLLQPASSTSSSSVTQRDGSWPPCRRFADATRRPDPSTNCRSGSSKRSSSVSRWTGERGLLSSSSVSSGFAWLRDPAASPRRPGADRRVAVCGVRGHPGSGKPPLPAASGRSEHGRSGPRGRDDRPRTPASDTPGLRPPSGGASNAALSRVFGEDRDVRRGLRPDPRRTTRDARVKASKRAKCWGAIIGRCRTSGGPR